MRILIVEDEQNARAAMEMYLGATSHEVRAASSGDEAIGLIEEAGFEPHVLICDWMLKGSYDGVDVAQRVLELCPQVILIFITGQSIEELERAAADLPVCRYVTKPFGLDTLDGVLRLCVQEHRQRSRAQTAH